MNLSESDDKLRRRWDQRHGSAVDLGQVALVLERNLHLLPVGGEALDLACGRGASSLRLAEAGMQVTAWDLSPVAIGRLQRAAARGVRLEAQVRDVIKQPPPAEGFDLILVSYFLERSLASSIIAALRPGGLLFYQTFIRDAVSDTGPSNPAYRLDDNELLELFRPLKVCYYREEGRLGNLSEGSRDIAMLVAQKSSSPLEDRVE